MSNASNVEKAARDLGARVSRAEAISLAHEPGNVIARALRVRRDAPTLDLPAVLAKARTAAREASHYIRLALSGAAVDYAEADEEMLAPEPNAEALAQRAAAIQGRAHAAGEPLTTTEAIQLAKLEADAETNWEDPSVLGNYARSVVGPQEGLPAREAVVLVQEAALYRKGGIATRTTDATGRARWTEGKPLTMPEAVRYVRQMRAASG